MDVSQINRRIDPDAELFSPRRAQLDEQQCISGVFSSLKDSGRISQPIKVIPVGFYSVKLTPLLRNAPDVFGGALLKLHLARSVARLVGRMTHGESNGK